MGNNDDSASLVNLNLNGQKENTYDVIVMAQASAAVGQQKNFVKRV